MPALIRIVLADDHDMIRESWKLLLERASPNFKVIATVNGGQEAISQTINLLPDIVLMDINMAPMNGFDATARILESVPSCRIIGISVNNNHLYAEKMMKLGARGFVTKTSSLDELKKAIMEVHRGKTYICEEIRKKK